MNHRREPCSAEIYAVITAGMHDRLTVHTTYTGPNEFSPTRESMTEWGLRDAPVPLVGHHARWEDGNSGNCEHKYWLCIPKDES